jgi:hypothetical protein
MSDTYTLREDNIVFYAHHSFKTRDFGPGERLLILKDNYLIKCRYNLFTCDRFFKDEDWFE